MAVRTVVVTADKVKGRKRNLKVVKSVILIMFLSLISLFLILSVIYNGGNFTISLDPSFGIQSGIIMYEDSVKKDSKSKIFAKELSSMDNISIDWIPKDINLINEGSHNGENYIAHTFYIENEGKDTIHYWYNIVIDDVIKNVDEAIRIMIIRNNKKDVYAKVNSYTKKEEPQTKIFDSKKYAVLKERRNFKQGDIDKFTVVIWLEGDDPDCLDNLIGGEIKMRMNITESHFEQKNNDEK